MPRYVDIECNAVTEVIGRRAFKNREDIQEFLDNIPTVDVVEVVRCGACGNYCKNTGECNLFGHHPGKDGYCSRGKKYEG